MGTTETLVPHIIEDEDTSQYVRDELVPHRYNDKVEWFFDGVSAFFISSGATGAASETVKNIGSYLGFPEGSTKYMNMSNFSSVGLLFLGLGGLFYDLMYYNLGHTRKFLGHIKNLVKRPDTGDRM